MLERLVVFDLKDSQRLEGVSDEPCPRARPVTTGLDSAAELRDTHEPLGTVGAFDCQDIVFSNFYSGLWLLCGIAPILLNLGFGELDVQTTRQKSRSQREREWSAASTGR